MGFFTRPDIDNRQFKQETTAQITLSGLTNFFGTLQSKGIEIDATLGGPYAESNLALGYSGGKIKLITVSGTSGTGSTVVTANNGLTICGLNHVQLGGVLTGDTCVCTNNFGIILGRNSVATGANSFAQGRGTQATGLYSHAEGYKSCAIGYASHAEGFYTKAIGTHSHTEGKWACAEGNNSHAGGLGGEYNILFACGTVSFNHSESTGSQTVGHGALANNSAILGGIDHNIESGNTGAAIIGGSTIKLTGTSYINTTAVDKLALMTTPTNNASSDEVLVRNTVTGLVDYVSKASIGSISLADNSIMFYNNGAVSADSNFLFDNSNNGMVLGTTCGSLSLHGDNSLTIGINSDSQANNSIAIGNHALTSSYGVNSIAVGDYSQAENCNAIALGRNTLASGNDVAIAIGRNVKSDGSFSTNISHGNGDYGYKKTVVATGQRSIAITNIVNFGLSCGGARGSYTSIFGGVDNDIAPAASCVTLLGTKNVLITGTTYDDHVVIPSLAIMTVPTNNATTDQVLVRNTTTGIVDYVSKASISPTVGNGLSISGSTVVLGGTLTGNTVIETTTAFGIAFGDDATASSGGTAFGYRTNAFGAGAHAEGFRSCAILGYSELAAHAEGVCTRALASGAHSEGNYNCATGQASHAQGICTIASGCASHAGGCGTYNGHEIIASGAQSFNHSFNVYGTSTAGHGALAIGSAILGGQDHNIEVGNTGAVIIGGNAIRLTGTSYIDTTAVDKLALMTTPSNNASSDEVLVRNTSTGLVDYVSKSSLGGTPTVGNGLSISGSTVVLGGTLTGETCIDTNNFGVVIGNTSTATGSHAIALGYNANASGAYSLSHGFSLATGCYSVAFGFGGAYGDVSFAGNNSYAYGGCSVAFGRVNCTFSNASAIIGGQENCIEVGNTGAAIIGGNTIVLTGTTYVNTTAVDILAIMTAPSAGGANDVLTWESGATGHGIIKKVPQSSLSDCRLKTNIEEVTCIDLTSLCGVSFEFNELVPQAGDCAYGLLAQDVEKVFPLAVKDNYAADDGNIYKTVDYKQLVPILLNKVKELEERIVVLEG